MRALRTFVTMSPQAILQPMSCKPVARVPRVYGAKHNLCLARLSSRPSRRALLVRLDAQSRSISSFEQQIPIHPKYDATENTLYWDTRPVTVIQRMMRIGVEFSRWVVYCRVTSDKDRQAAALRDVLCRLGPAFVKIGQALSSRPDVLPPRILRELEKLQDRIPPFPTDQAFQVIEADMGAPLSQVFSEISEEPVAAASLGQVYKAVLRSTGEQVAVKVQRPGVVEMISKDVYILRSLAFWLRKVRKLNSDLPSLVDEWASSLFRELDYTTEADNAIRFKRLYAYMPEVYVPNMYEEITTPKVLVMEWVDGEKVRTATATADIFVERRESAKAASTSAPSSTAPVSRPLPRTASSSSSAAAAAAAAASAPASLAGLTSSSAAPDDNLRLVEVGVQCSLEQMLEQGFYHADPHPGNLLRMPDGRLCYLDFGMMGSIDRATRQALIRATLHLVNREFGELAQDFVSLGLLPTGSDKEKVVPALTGVFEQALAQGVSNLSFGDLSLKLGQTMYQFKFRIPPYYTLLVRSLSVLEGIALASDPNYKVLGAAYPWIARRLLTDQTPELQSTLRALLYKNNRFQFSRLESLLQQAVKAAAPDRPAAAAARAANNNNSSPPAPPSRPTPSTTPRSVATATTSNPAVLPKPGHPIDPLSIPPGGRKGTALALLLSPEGDFVRGILLDELAKGVDAAWRLAFDSVLDTARQRVAVALPLSLWGMRPSTPPTPSNDPLSGGFIPTNQGPAALMSALTSLPQLAGEEDREQVEGLTRLATLMVQVAQRPAAGAASSSSSTSSSSSSYSSALSGQNPSETIEQAAAFLRWLANEIGELSPAAREEALKLPLQLGARVTSRVAARALRSALLGASAVAQSSTAATSSMSATPVSSSVAAAASNPSLTRGVPLTRTV